jgi:hypothetical protein
MNGFGRLLCTTLCSVKLAFTSLALNLQQRRSKQQSSSKYVVYCSFDEVHQMTSLQLHVLYVLSVNRA